MKKTTMYGWGSEKYPTNDNGNYIIPISDIGKQKGKISFHDVVSDNPKYYGSPEYEALKHSIEVDGYDSSFPIWIWRGKIVDGWHRVMVSMELNNENIEAIELPYKTPLDDIKRKVVRTEIGRQMTKTTLAIKAWRKWKDGTYKSVAQAALNIGSTATAVKSVSYVAKHGDTDWIDAIYNGESVRYGDSLKSTDNIFTIKSFLEKQKAEAGKDQFDKIYRKMTDPEIESLKRQIETALNGVEPVDVKSIANHIYRIHTESTKGK